MRVPHTRRLTASAAVICTVVVLTARNPAAEDSSLSPVVEGLDSARGVAVGPAGRLLFTEIDGSFSEVVMKGHNAGAVTILGSVPPNFIAPAIASDGRGQIYVLTAAGPPGSGLATLYRSTPGSPSLRPFADIGAYQQTDPDPYNLKDDPEESNPFGVATLPDGSVLVSDAAANDLLRVFPNGRIVTVARLKPRMVPVPAELPAFLGLPPAGTLIPSEDVATSVTVGADGYYYVGELRGVPATPGTSQVWRIAPNSENALCDPEAPNTGACRRYADGFTSIVNLGAGPDGSIYVVELVKQSWFQWQLGLVDPPVGGVFRIPPGGGAPVELAPGELVLPAGVAVGRDGAVYVTSPVFGPGTVSQIQ
jgi:hypothetical protein